MVVIIARNELHFYVKSRLLLLQILKLHESFDKTIEIKLPEKITTGCVEKLSLSPEKFLNLI